MPTPVGIPVFYALMTFYAGAGTAMPVAKEGGYLTSFFSEADCNKAREARPHPEDFYCLRFESPKTIDYKFPKDLRQEGSNDAPPEPNPKLSDPAGIQTKNDDVQLAGGHYHYSRPLFLWIKDEPGIKVADKPYIEPRVDAPAAQPTKQRRVARRPQQQQFDPIGALVSLLTPRDW